MIFLIAFLLRPLLSLRALVLFDGGFALSFGLGLAVSFIFSWSLSAIGLFRFDTLPFFIVLIILTVLVNLLSLKRKLCFRWTREEFFRFLLGAALFFLLFAIAFYVKGFRGSIDSQTEQFMDFGFMQSMYRQKEARPFDLWFSGERLNYYYLGQAAAVFLCRLSLNTPEYGYNLMLVTIFATVFMMVFSLCEAIISALSVFSKVSFAVRRRYGLPCALLGALATTCGANGHFVVYGLILPFLERVTGRELVKDFWFPDSTTFIGGYEGSLDHGKHEYPAYTVILGDLHAHVVNMLFTLPLLVLLFDYAAFVARQTRRMSGKEGGSAAVGASVTESDGSGMEEPDEEEPEREGLSGLLSGLFQEEDEFSQVMRAMNKTAYLELRKKEEKKTENKEASALPKDSEQTGALSETEAAKIEPIGEAAQIEPIEGTEQPEPESKEDRETLGAQKISFWKKSFSSDRPLLLHYVLLSLLLGLYCGVNYWDFPIYFVISGAVILFCDLDRFGASLRTVLRVLAKGGAILLLSQLAVLPFNLSFEKISSELGLCDRHSKLSELLLVWGFKFYVAIALLILIALAYRRTRHLGAMERALAAVALCAMGLILSPELIYVKDIYGEDFKRYNTMFKLTYQGFILFGILTGVTAAVFLSGRRLLKLQAVLMIVASLLSSVYIIQAADMWFGNFLLPDNRTGISAMDFMRRGENEYGLEWGAIEYLNGLSDRRINIVETAGTSYQPDDKLSVFTGASTVIGWFVHEWLWRSDSEIVGYRTGEVRSFYEGGDRQYCRDFLDRYAIEYVYLGPREYNNYVIRTDGFYEYCTVVWENQGYALLRVNQY
ncbi:MAG: hypothetical protein IJT16_08865 [Lachnospiraceae bacterium]|nr:hypothetical protein [Lachnospiraceae bacterium]